MCLAHIYGNALYYGTTIIQGCPDSRPEFLYFWVYFLGLNGLWLITPIGELILPQCCSKIEICTVLLIKSIRKISTAIQIADRKENEKKSF